MWEPVKPLPDVDDDLMRLLLDGLAFETHGATHDGRVSRSARRLANERL